MIVCNAVKAGQCPDKDCVHATPHVADFFCKAEKLDICSETGKYCWCEEVEP